MALYCVRVTTPLPFTDSENTVFSPVMPAALAEVEATMAPPTLYR